MPLSKMFNIAKKVSAYQQDNSMNRTAIKIVLSVGL